MYPLPRYQRRRLTRRDFLKASFTSGGALLIGAFLDACVPTVQQTEIPTSTIVPTSTSTPEPAQPFQPNLFIRIDPDGAVNLIIHRSEMGQGVRTSLAMILVEELEADWSTVRIEQMDARSQSEVNQITSGSGSIRINYENLREAGARARQILIAAAAQKWGVTSQECKAESSTVIHLATGERLGYGELVGIASQLKLTSVSLKDPQEFKLIGKSMPRVDDPAIVNGRAIYGIDMRVPGMLYATVARAPVFAGWADSFDSTEAESIPGVQTVVQVPSGIAVVAENTWAAIRGRDALNITWHEGANAELSSQAIHQALVDRMNEALANEERTNLKTIEAVYETPYLAHAPLEPVNCIADVRSDVCELWLPTQNPQAVQEFVRDRLGMETVVHVTLIGGGFGRKLEVDFALEAADVSRAIGGPVQVVWTREDDIQHDFYRQVTYHSMKAGWDANGSIGLWRHYLASQGIRGVAYYADTEVLEEDIVAPYEMNGRTARALLVSLPVPTGPWRGVVSATNGYANECFFDEVAAALNRDPYELRMELLPANDQLRTTLQVAAEKAGWGTPLEQGHGRGIACHKTYGLTSVAMVADVSVQDGQVRVHKVVCAISCGMVVHPDMVAQQMEGGIVFGLTSLLYGEITFEKGRVQQSNFEDYPLLQLREMPEVEVHIVEDNRPPLGLGEMGVPPVVPAVVNAIFNASGKRIRHTPIRPDDL